MEMLKIQQLLTKYYDGATTEDEEKEIQHFFSTAVVPDSLKLEASFFIHLARLKDEEPTHGIDADWVLEKAKYNKNAGRKVRLSTRYYWPVAASFFLLITAIWMAIDVRHRQAREQEHEIAVLREEVRELKQVLATNASVSDRLRVVSQEFDSTKDKGAIESLINTLVNDDNINVRLAACESLYRFRYEARVKAAYLNALSQESDPMVQFILIDVLILLQEKGADREFRRLLQSDSTSPEVRENAARGLADLNNM